MGEPTVAYFQRKSLAILSTVVTLSTAFVTIGLTAQSGQAATITLDFNSLPSQQGWNYYSIPGYIPDSTVFSTNGTTLVQNTMGTGLYSQGSNYYRLFGATNSSLPFTLEVRARVLQEETNVSYENSFGFFLTANFGSDAAGIGISPNRIQFADGTTINRTIDNRQFHTYLLKGQVGKELSIYVDEELIYKGDFLKGSYPSMLAFGDGTGGTNARSELTYFRFSQDPVNLQSVPEPTLMIGTITATALTLLLKRKSF
ncbi:MAG: hypothetical protein SFW36_15315 [Leptolyngbyaceae cyanobacterium bins.59]|nr:hypothetical protein [Leptolyngbyaceae cyanobacterium bins.59]